MSDNLSHDVGYEPPNKEFIRNSLLYGLSSENEADSTRSSSQSYEDSYSDLSRILKNKGKIERALIRFFFDNKRRIKSIPWLGKFALSVKRYLLKKNLSEETPGFSRLDLSGIMGLEVNDFINQLYILSLGRAPDDKGWSNIKYLLCSGAPREAVAFMICTSKEFANRAQVAYLDEYRKVFWHYRLRRGFQRLPLVGYIWAIAAIPRRIYRLEVEERIHHVDTQFIERQRFEALSTDLHSSQNRIDALYAENTDLRSNFNSLLSQNKTLQTQVESLNAEIKAGFKDLS
ncbi:MAG: DUF4214 domain-containing protein, partial [Candidatus Helarchaeota archaeon]|nr:DUF4214 domain-containing protein [Candidatus Helarchaeota archaeon]